MWYFVATVRHYLLWCVAADSTSVDGVSLHLLCIIFCFVLFFCLFLPGLLIFLYESTAVADIMKF